MISCDNMADVFERIYAAVMQEATRPQPYARDRHLANQAAFCAQLRTLAAAARLRCDMSADDLWWHVWTKIRYAGFRASYATGEICRLTAVFGNFRTLGTDNWRFDPTEAHHGCEVQNFLGKTGRFANIRYSKLKPKLQKILVAAAKFRSFGADVRPLEALFGSGFDNGSDDAFWRAHSHLAEVVGYTTALHIMMDIGFDCVKPDIWLVRLMCRLGWIADVLHPEASEDTIRKKYQTPDVAAAVIAAARLMVAALQKRGRSLSIREVDFILVKYGQNPGEFGIVRSLHRTWRPVQYVMEWQPTTTGPVGILRCAPGGCSV
jgi:hypothetical protein